MLVTFVIAPSAQLDDGDAAAAFVGVAEAHAAHAATLAKILLQAAA
jgi:hypothetical protein